MVRTTGAIEFPDHSENKVLLQGPWNDIIDSLLFGFLRLEKLMKPRSQLLGLNLALELWLILQERTGEKGHSSVP